MTTTTKYKILEDLKNTSFSYRSSDSPATFILNKIAGDLYPDKSFDNLVSAIRHIDGCEKLANAIAEHGIQFKLISQGDTHVGSAWVERNTIGCSTEEWYMETGSPVYELWVEIEPDDDIAEEVGDAIGRFEMEICSEVVAEAEKRYGFVPTDEKISDVAIYHYLHTISFPIKSKRIR